MLDSVGSSENSGSAELGCTGSERAVQRRSFSHVCAGVVQVWRVRQQRYGCWPVCIGLESGPERNVDSNRRRPAASAPTDLCTSFKINNISNRPKLKFCWRICWRKSKPYLSSFFSSREREREREYMRQQTNRNPKTHTSCMRARG